MKNICLILVLLVAVAARAQIDTNVIFITGAGTAAFNTEYQFDGAGDYTNGSGQEAVHTGLPADWWELGNYSSTNFPYTWFYNYQGDSGVAPAPTGVYDGQSSAGPPIFYVRLTNFWSLPGDVVSFQASGRNMATTNNQTAVEILLDTNIIFQSAASAGNGAQFRLDGRMQWDGTNINYFAEMNSGGPLGHQTPVFGTFFDVLGTNTFQIVPLINTNGLIFLNAGVVASRAPQGSTNAAGTTATWGIGTFSLHAN